MLHWIIRYLNHLRANEPAEAAKRQKIFFLNALPVEVLVNVLHNLHNDDLFALAKMKEMKDTVIPLLSHAYQSEDPSTCPGKYTYYGLRFTSFKGKAMEDIPPKSAFFVFADVSSSLTSLTVFAKARPSLDVRVNITGLEMDNSLINESFSSLVCHFHSVTFAYLLDLKLEEVTIDPAFLRFPKLKSLNLTECQVVNGYMRLELPSLNILHCSVSFASIQSSLDFKKTPLSELHLDDITDLTSLDHIHCPTLLALEIEDSHRLNTISSLSDIHLKKLERFKYMGQFLESFSDIFFGKVRFLRINDGFMSPPSNVSLKRVNMPYLYDLSITVLNWMDISNVSFPSLSRTSLSYKDTRLLERNFEEIDSSFLHIVNSLTLYECSSLLLSKALESFLHLNSLHILDDNGFFNSETFHPSLILPQVRRLRIFSSYGHQTPLNLRIIHQYFPRLSELAFSVKELLSLSTILSFPTLKKLEVSVERTDSDFLTKTRFPSLKSAKVYCRASNLAQELLIVAPMLGELYASVERIQEFNLRGCPSLNDLTIFGNIDSIVLGSECSNLRSVVVSGNSQLSQFKSCCTLKKLVSIQGRNGTPYVDDFNLLKFPSLISEVTWNRKGDYRNWKREKRIY